MRNKLTKQHHQGMRMKGEIVEGKDTDDLEPTGRYMRHNPYKTPPNNLTSKDICFAINILHY